MSIDGSAPDRQEGVVEHPVRGVLAHLDPVDVGGSEMDAEPDPGVDRRLVQVAGLVEVAGDSGEPWRGRAERHVQLACAERLLEGSREGARIDDPLQRQGVGKVSMGVRLVELRGLEPLTF